MLIARLMVNIIQTVPEHFASTVLLVTLSRCWHPAMLSKSSSRTCASVVSCTDKDSSMINVVQDMANRYHTERFEKMDWFTCLEVSRDNFIACH